MKRIRTIQLDAEARKLPNDIVGYAINNDGDPTVFEDMEATPENVEKAKSWLASKRSSSECWNGYTFKFYKITVYAIEYYTADEDGEFIEGSDYDTADVKKKFYTADRETGTFIDEVDSVQEGLELISRYEDSDKADGIFIPNFYDVVDQNHCTQI